MTEDTHRRVMHGMASVLSSQAWERMADFWHTDCVLEFPQSGERLRGPDTAL